MIVGTGFFYLRVISLNPSWLSVAQGNSLSLLLLLVSSADRVYTAFILRRDFYTFLKRKGLSAFRRNNFDRELALG